MSETPDPGEYQPGSARPWGEDSTPAGREPAPGYQAQVPPGGADPGDPSGQGYRYGQQDPFGQQASYGQGTPYGQQAPYGQGTPSGQSYPQPDSGPAPILMSFAPAMKQRRLTVFFRVIMAIPAVVVLGFVSIAAYVVGIIGWWAALFMGRLPGWAFEFMSGFVRWTARVQAYNYLLTDQYPPFTLDDADYPVRLVTRPTRLSRLAVFFRFILVIPVYLLAIICGIGLGLLSVVAWVAALFAGKVPDSLHQAMAALLRFYVRFLGYWLLITPEYPGGLYGDKITAAVPPGWTADTAAAGAASGDTAPITGFGAAPGPWQLVLSGGARSLVTVGLVLGVLGLGADAWLQSSVFGNAINNGNRVVANNTVTNDYNKLGTVIGSFQSKTAACQQNLTCVTSLDSQVAQAFRTFGTGLAGAGVPSSFAADVATLTADNTKVQNDFSQLATAQSASQYTSIASGLSLQSDLTGWQSAFDKLHNELNKP